MRRLIQGEGNLADQVESRRKQLELANQLEEDDSSSETIDEVEVMSSIEYEGDDDLEQELESDDSLCLN